MTAKQLFESVLVELNKKEAPSLLLEDYNYFINKAISQYVNKIYNSYDINQQRTDDLRVLKSSAILTPYLPASGSSYMNSDLLKNIYTVVLPDDYLHILNCIVEYEVKENYKCYDAGNRIQMAADRLPSGAASQIINNYYMRPSYRRPYYYINNVNIDNVIKTEDNRKLVYTNISLSHGLTSGSITLTLPGNTPVAQVFTYSESSNSGSLFTTMEELQDDINGTFPTIKTTLQNNVLLIPGELEVVGVTGGVIKSDHYKMADINYGNSSKVTMEIRYGKNQSIFEVKIVYVDYIKTPKFIRLTQEQVDTVVDTSQVLEFPDYVIQEIINELVSIIMENASDPRLQTHIPISQSIGSPVAQEQK
jgi:hypothetical protein